ncbi:MAG TPA: hypothetical protein VM582_05455 [Candidatus Thermoplasmatota archaeon]|nr:hypothetical protein [Candidatus Thermoplasmatota archaeon]
MPEDAPGEDQQASPAARIENETFFASAPRVPPQPSVPEEAFYAGRERPPLEVPVAVRAAATPLRFALVISAVGWGGILFQAGILQQIVFGAPVFEELAKFGPPLALVVLLGARSLWVRLPLAWAAGAAFGVMEHYVTYVEEPAYLYAGRVAFHAIAPGLSMLVYGAIETFPDVRARWAATVPATLFHWANNFAALMLGIVGALTRLPVETVGLTWAGLVTAAMAAATLVALLARARVERAVRRAIEVAMPRLGFAPPRVVGEERRVEDLQPL